MVLIIDSDPNVFCKMKCALQNKMIGVYHAVSANEGIKLLTQHSFCLVIMDIIQPEINGIDLLKLIRQIRSIPVDIPLILGNLITIIFDYQILRKPLKTLSL